jgi:hypothetical protein
MKAHKFQTGQFVRLTARVLKPEATTRYEVVRLMPPEGTVNQYRVRSVDDGHERMVKESDLA